MSQGYSLSIFDGGEYVTTIIGKRIVDGVHCYVCQLSNTEERYYWTAEALSVFYSKEVASWEEIHGNRWAIDHIANREDSTVVVRDGEVEAAREVYGETESGAEGSPDEDDGEEDEKEEEDETDEEDEETYSRHVQSDSEDGVGEGDSYYNLPRTPSRRRKFQMTPEKLPLKKRRLLNYTEDDELEEVDSQVREASQALINKSMAEPSPPPICQDVEMLDVNIPTSDLIMQQLLSARDSSLHDVVNKASYIQDLPHDSWEKLNASGFNDRQRNWIKISAVFILAAMDEHVLRHLITGDVPKASHMSLELRMSIFKLQQMELNARKPSIYINYLVDDNGNSPNPSELLEILENMELYMEKDNLDSTIYATRVDTRMGCQRAETLRGREAAIRKNERKYLQDGTQSDKAREFIAALRKRLRGSVEFDQPLSRPLCEVGYATFPLSRIEQHKKHISSNRLMNLVEAICMADFPRYRIHGYVLFHCFEPAHAHVGEILFTRISQSYITHGGGFNHHPAGISNHHAWETDVKLCRSIRNETTSKVGYIARIAGEKKIVKEINQKWELLEENMRGLEEDEVELNKKVEELERLEAERTKAEHDGNLEILKLLQTYDKLVDLVLSLEHDETT